MGTLSFIWFKIATFWTEINNTQKRRTIKLCTAMKKYLKRIKEKDFLGK